eukprot:scaffold5098_cov130-Skeletonema_menzelii.AAC.1
MESVVCKSLDEGSRREELKEENKSWLNNLLEGLGALCFPDNGSSHTVKSESAQSAASRTTVRTADYTVHTADSNGIEKISFDTSAEDTPALAKDYALFSTRSILKNKTETNTEADGLFGLQSKSVSWITDGSIKTGADCAIQFGYDTSSQAQEQAQEQAQAQARRQGMAQHNSISSKTSAMSKKEASNNILSGRSSPIKKGLFRKATHNKKESSQKSTQPMQQQVTEDRQDTNQDWRHVAWRSVVSDKPPIRNQATAYDLPSVFVPPRVQSASGVGVPMNGQSYGYGYGGPHFYPQQHGQHFYPQHHSSPYGSNYTYGAYSPPHQPPQYPCPPQQQYQQNYLYRVSSNPNLAFHYGQEVQVSSPMHHRRYAL